MCPGTLNAIARPEPDGGLTVWVTTNALYNQKIALCGISGLPPSKVRVITPYADGGFGGRGMVIVLGIATLLALKTERPVKLVYSRDEVFVDSNPREAMVIYIKDGVKADGTLMTKEMRLILDAGAYSGVTILVAKNAAFSAVGSYRTPNFRLDSYAVATNNPPTGAFRGFGSTEVIWAVESQIFEIASKNLGVSPERLFIKDGVIYVRGEDKSIKVAQLFIPLRYLPDGGEILGYGTYFYSLP